MSNKNKVLIENVPTIVTTSFIGILFSRGDIYGSDVEIINIERNEIDKRLSVFIIEYRSSEMARRVVQHGAVTFGVSRYEPILLDDKKKLNINEDTAVLVTNVDETEVETVLLFYAKEKTSGGGTISKYIYDKDYMEVIIFYKDIQVTKRVLDFGPVLISNKEFRARNFKTERSKVVIENVDKSMTDELVLIFENEKRTGGADTVKQEYDPVKKNLILSYENTEIANRVIKFGEVFYKNRIYKAKRFI